jgi:Ubiquitin fusion degradation protein UFD1
MKFRGFVSLTEGDTISIESELPDNSMYKFDIVEVKPKSPFKTIITLNCDLKLDFEEPLDYVEPAPQYLE